MERTFIVTSGVLGFLGVLLGAFGAHGLQRFLSSAEDAAERLEWWETAAQYHLVHAVAIALSGLVVSRSGVQAAGTAAGFCFAGGVFLFSGSLYAMTLTGVRALGAVTPLGGLLFLAGWALLAVAGAQLR